MIALSLLTLPNPAWLPVFIFLARVTDVSIGTIRMICVMRDRRVAAIVLGFCEVTIWIIAVSGVLSHLDHWVNVLAFAAGFAAGSALGMWIEHRLALGMQTVSIFSADNPSAIAEQLRAANLKVTTLVGTGRDRPVSVFLAVVPRRQTAAVVALARSADPEVVITIEDVRETSTGKTEGTRPRPWFSQVSARLRALIPGPIVRPIPVPSRGDAEHSMRLPARTTLDVAMSAESGLAAEYAARAASGRESA